MRLGDLDPQWFAEPARRGQGVSFWCPHCAGNPGVVRLAVAFSNPLDGGDPVSLSPRKLWPLLNVRPEGVRGVVTVAPGTLWNRAGDGFDRLTVSPSVDASRSGHWHGFIETGAMRTA